jgi:predicted secreted hydrolase
MRILLALLLAGIASACGGGEGGASGSVTAFGGLQTISGGKNRITLSWDAAQATGTVTYHVFRRMAGNSHDFLTSVASTTALEFSDRSIATGLDYFYVVRATADGVHFDDNVVELSAYAVAVALPEDDGPHAYDVEWWYYTGHLDDGQGNAWGFEFTFFKLELGAVPLYLGNVAITDHQRGTFVYAERPGTNQRQHPQDGFAIQVGSWILLGGAGSDRIEVSHDDVQQGLSYSLTLDLSALKEPILHGRDGITGEGSELVSYYYSRTRLAVSGTLDDNGTMRSVSGLAWMDHQWLDESASSGLFVIDGWDWHSIQFENGVDLMLTEVRLDLGGLAYAAGTWIEADGSYEGLDMSQVVIQPLGSWTNPISGHTYPSGWSIEIPAKDLSMTLEPVLEDQELWDLAITPILYWEGEVRVSATLDGAAVQGRGYVELTGYDD